MNDDFLEPPGETPSFGYLKDQLDDDFLEPPGETSSFGYLKDQLDDDFLEPPGETPSFGYLKDQLEKFMVDFRTVVLERLSRLEDAVQPQPRRPFTDLNQAREPPNSCNGQLNNSAIQSILSNPKIKNGVQLGMELAKSIFTEHEMASSTLTGWSVNGNSRGTLDPMKLHLIDNLIKEKFQMSEAEFSGIRSGFRVALANRCKYLRLKMAPQNRTLI